MMRKQSAKVLFLTLAVVFASAAMAASSAPAAVLHHWVCRFEGVGKGSYNEPDCFGKGISNDWERHYIAAGGEKVKSKNVSKNEFELESTIGGVATVIKCTTVTSAGTAQNPEPLEKNAGEGTTTYTYEGCTVTKPLESGCSIPGKKFVSSELHSVLEENKSLGAGTKFSPVSGEVFAEVTFEKCKNAGLNKKYTVKGTDFGVAHNEEGMIEFTNASSSLTLGGVEAKLRGKSTQEEQEGNMLLILP